MLRNVSEHINNQNWFAVTIDFLIVVIGVFLGLQAQEWNQHRTDRAKAKTYIQRLSADFATIDQDLQQCLSVYRDSIDSLTLISEVIKDQAASDSPPSIENPDRIKTALIRMTAGTIPAGRSATFIEMLSTGNLSILHNNTLRDALIAYDEHAQISRETWRSLREQSIAYIGPLYSKVALEVDLDKKQISSIKDFDLNGMARDPDFHAMLNVLAGNKGNNYELCQVQLKLVNNVQQALTRN